MSQPTGTQPDTPAPGNEPGGGQQQPPAGGQPTPPAGGAPPAQPGQQPDLSKLTVDQLKGHPEFQSELNRVVTERLAKEQEKWQQKLETEKQRASLDEAGKLQAQLEDERKAADEARQQVQAAFQAAARTKAEVLAIAEGGRADRAAAIVAQADLTGAVNEDGTVNEAVVKAAVVKVLGDYPEWKGQAPPPTRSGGEMTPPAQPGAQWTKSQVEAMSQEDLAARWPEIEKAMAEGRFLYDQ